VPSFVGIGAESAELAPDSPGFGLCAAEPSLEDRPPVRRLALRAHVGCLRHGHGQQLAEPRPLPLRPCAESLMCESRL
jgi:hypothetical protein